ncbi:MAG: hypothetical protein LBF91_01980 [Azoarcus sp.]|jgi:hypothetical protein|nr:hypothetical protein [Azoarcus sp.]
MPILVGITVLIQFCFAFHALKTGRPQWWIFVIMAFPVMGSVIYYFVEIFPGSREHRSARKAARKIAKALQPDADLKRRIEELEICGSADNRIALAQECMNHRIFGEAIRLYESCLSGALSNDESILYGLLRATVEAKEWDKAELALSRLREAAPKYCPNDVLLLEARILDGRGVTDAALAAYRALLPVFVGLEARYRYGDLLSRVGQHEAALYVFNELVAHSRRFTSAIEDEQQWVDAARQSIRCSPCASS